MNREIRTPSLGNRINKLLKELPTLASGEIEEIFRCCCIRVDTVHGKTKTSNAFRERMEQLEFWTDGFATAGGGELSIVAGTWYMDFGVDPSIPKTMTRRMVIFVVLDVEQFMIDLRETVTMVAVQKS